MESKNIVAQLPATTSNNHLLYSWGLNATGQLGLNQLKAKKAKGDHRMLPTEVKAVGKKVIGIAAF